MGIAIYPDDGDTIERIVSAADAAMYRIKHDEKNGFAFASDAP
jgi:GGDEF domain-containing protein